MRIINSFVSYKLYHIANALQSRLKYAYGIERNNSVVITNNYDVDIIPEQSKLSNVYSVYRVFTIRLIS